MPIAMIVLAIVAHAVASAQRGERNVRVHSEALRAQHAGLERMTRELREATSFQYVSSQAVQFELYVRRTGTTRSIRYDCSSASRCSRLEGPPGGTPTGPVTLVDGLENPNVFSAEPDPLAARFVGIVARVRTAPNRPSITLRDGVQLRNLSSRF